MTAHDILQSLALPSDAMVDQRVPKKLLLEQGAPTPTDKRHIQDGIEEMTWGAALKPVNCGVPVFKDSTREYLEVTVLKAVLRDEAKSARLIELIHRAIPYPVVLVAEQHGNVNLSLAHKRWSQGEAGKTVLEGEISLASFNHEKYEQQFADSIALAKQPRGDFFALYQGWVDCIIALQVARITGVFTLPGSADRAANLRAGLDRHMRLVNEIAALRAQAEEEKQINKRVDLNLEIKRLESVLREIITKF